MRQQQLDLQQHGPGVDGPGGSSGQGAGSSTSPSGGTSTSPSGGASAPAEGVAAVGACKGAVQAQSVPSGIKHKLEAICEKASSGNIEDIKRTAEQACKELVRARIPAGPTQEKATARCARH